LAIGFVSTMTSKLISVFYPGEGEKEGNKTGMYIQSVSRFTCEEVYADNDNQMLQTPTTMLHKQKSHQTMRRGQPLKAFTLPPELKR
jgi:hypothetical protein